MSTAPSRLPNPAALAAAAKPAARAAHAIPSTASAWVDRLIAWCSAADLAHLSRFLNWRV